jgi:hypothetical protein
MKPETEKVLQIISIVCISIAFVISLIIIASEFYQRIDHPSSINNVAADAELMQSNSLKPAQPLKDKNFIIERGALESLQKKDDSLWYITPNGVGIEITKEDFSKIEESWQINTIASSSMGSLKNGNFIFNTEKGVSLKITEAEAREILESWKIDK